MNKICTSQNQSKKLAEILPLESADMYYSPFGDDTHPWVWENDLIVKDAVLCWSLAALLSVLSFPVLYMEMIGGMILWSCECHFMETDGTVKKEHYDNPVDACYDMIIKLHEDKLL